MLKKLILISISALLTGVVCGGEFYELECEGLSLSRGKEIKLMYGGVPVGEMKTDPEADLKLVDVKIDGEDLVIDTTRYRAEYPDGRVLVYCYGIDHERLVRDGKTATTLEVEASCRPAGGRMNLLFEGVQYQKDGEELHYWREKFCNVKEHPGDIEFTEILPADVERLHVRVDMADAGEYRIESVELKD